MSWLTRRHKQDIVYWGTPANDGLGGITFATPVEIKCRWEDVKKKFTDSNGNEVVSSSIVYLGQDADIGGWLFEGTLADISSADEDSPGDVDGAKEIKGFSKIPNIDATDYERVAFL